MAYGYSIFTVCHPGLDPGSMACQPMVDPETSSG